MGQPMKCRCPRCTRTVEKAEWTFPFCAQCDSEGCKAAAEDRYAPREKASRR